MFADFICLRFGSTYIEYLLLDDRRVNVIEYLVAEPNDAYVFFIF